MSLSVFIKELFNMYAAPDTVPVPFGAGLADTYKRAETKGHVLPFFPLHDRGRVKRDMQYQSALRTFFGGDENLHQEAVKKYPALSKGQLGLVNYFETNCLAPALLYTEGADTATLVFKLRGTDEFVARTLTLSHIARALEQAAHHNVMNLGFYQAHSELLINGCDRTMGMDERDAILSSIRVFENITGYKVNDPIRESFMDRYAAEDKAVEFNMSLGAVWEFAANARTAGQRSGGHLATAAQSSNFNSDDRKKIASDTRLALMQDWSYSN